MRIPVLIKRIAENGYQARSGEPVAAAAEGATRDEALARLRAELNAKLETGAELTTLDVGEQAHPLAKSAGIFSPDDPLVREWLDIIAENRRQADDDANAA